MLFHSIEYIFFLAIVYLVLRLNIYKHVLYQNIVLLGASYIFYGWWNYTLLFLVFVSTLTDFVSALQISKSASSRVKRFWLWCSISLNIGLLLYFKYWFFILEGWTFVTGQAMDVWTIILPVGISFYTFQTMSYTIDVYRNKCMPMTNFITFGTYVAFFPQLIAGPIERASVLLPQLSRFIQNDKKAIYAGIQLFIWGLFKKSVVADHAGYWADLHYGQYMDASGTQLWLATFLFGIQIYGDFSGYTDMAIGSARILGIHLSPNFSYPYFAVHIKDFWRRWHMSLTTWFRDYVYIPLGGNRHGQYRTYIHMLLVFLLSGLWHGAAWTFVIWGAFHGIWYILYVWQLDKKWMSHFNFSPYISMIVTYVGIHMGWVFFRADSIHSAWHILLRMGDVTSFNVSVTNEEWRLVTTCGLLFIMLCIEWYGRAYQNPIDAITASRESYMVYVIYFMLFMCIALFQAHVDQAFIYFQF